MQQQVGSFWVLGDLFLGAVQPSQMFTVRRIFVSFFDTFWSCQTLTQDFQGIGTYRKAVMCSGFNWFHAKAASSLFWQFSGEAWQGV